ncbi:esterase [Mesorhizobium sp. L-8-10]|uniref:alpha/beta hydrolase n=1 Tax=Mesorhizobium sp. L-8-10 TaxID=2744523 RepID=UPI0019264F10|nr:alpha/beta hydrolase [Mesorhizobium sp. L-8-10]BCH32093.1 esterase [Mesorhizobium sp. L-8-10]
MPSLKSHFVAFILKHSRKKAFTSPEGLHRWIARSRRTQDHRPPPKIAARITTTCREVQGFPVYEVTPKTFGDMRILYLHGGAYVFEITKFHWALIAEMAERLGARITVPVYPLAPEHDFHAMFGMVGEVYRGMLDETPENDIVFMGDSAGGNMAVVLTMMAVREGLPAPARHVLISPGLDMTLANPAVHAVERIDPWLGIPGGLEAVRLYSAGIERTDWRISPLYGDLSVLPRTLLFTGTRDILNPDSLIFAERARAAGIDVDLVSEPGMIHVWPLIDMPEARRARDRMVTFLGDIGGAGKSTPAPVRTAPSP